ncbi:MAG: diguanylate cyclase [Anaerolineales bacterium]|nr:diguanylate cyclase [Anaerolineales bacterium]
MNTYWAISGVLFVNFFIGIWLALRSAKKRTQGGQGYFALLMLMAGLFSLTYGLEIISTSVALKIFWLKLEVLSIVAIPPLWFMFSFVYTQQARWFSRKGILFLFVIPVLTLILVFSPLSHFYHASLKYETGMGPVTIEGGVWFWVQMAQNYFLLLLGFFVILRAVVRYPGIYRGQSTMLLIGVLIPILANLYYLFEKVLSPQSPAQVDFTPVAFIFGGLLFSFGVLRFGFLELAPIAREVVFEEIPEMVLVLDAENRVVDINHVGLEWFDRTHDQVTGRPVSELLKELPDLLGKYDHVGSIHESVTINTASPRDLELVITPLADSQGQVAGQVILARDVTSRNQTARLIEQRNEMINLQSAALNAAVNAVVITDLNGECIWVNRAFTDITGYSSGEALGKNLSFLKSGEQDQPFYEKLWNTILSGQIWQGEIINRHKNGHLYVEEMTIAPVYNEKREITNYVAIKQEITKRKLMERELQEANHRLQNQMQEIISLQDQLREQAIRDPLTGLYNRRILEEALERESAQAKRNESGFCIAMIDIDNFKTLNDRHSHSAGDMILKSLAGILTHNVRQGDISCRYGGDEFVVLMPNAAVEGALKRANQWRRAFQMLQKNFNGQELQVTLSIGIASYPSHGLSGQDILEAADGALYASKARGKNCVTVHTDGLNIKEDG